MALRPSLHRKLVVLVIAAVGAAVAVATAMTVWQQVSQYGAMRQQMVYEANRDLRELMSEIVAATA